MFRRFTALVFVALFAALPLGSTSAQNATPAAPLLAGADLELVAFAVEVTSDAFLAAPDVPAGRVLVTVTNSTTENASQPFFLEMPEGMSLDDVQATFAAISAMLQTGEMPADGSDPFAFLYQAHIAGGTSAPAGASRQVAVDLTPGSWVIADLDFIKPPVALQVTGEMPASLPEMHAAATLTAVDTGETFALRSTAPSRPDRRSSRS